MRREQSGQNGAQVPSILVVAEAKSHLLLGFETALRDFLYQIVTLPADIDALAGAREDISGLLLYAEEKLLEQQKSLLYVKDRLIEHDTPAFLLGGHEEIKAVQAIIPRHLFHYEFVRPININVHLLAERMHNYIRQHSVKKKILVVDDSGAWLRNVKGWLDEKYSVYLANSGTIAIKYLALNQPDLVLLDYAMPVADGRQVLEMIRSEAEFSQIPVMFLTNLGDKESILKVKDLKPEGYLLKSMPPAQIVKAVEDFFILQKGLTV